MILLLWGLIGVEPITISKGEYQEGIGIRGSGEYQEGIGTHGGSGEYQEGIGTHGSALVATNLESVTTGFR